MAYTTADIRNLCLIGPAHAGKTQLTEALLSTGGAISHLGSVEQKDTVSDFNAKERELGHSLYPSVCHLDHADIHINLIDTPGHPDFYGRTLSILPAVETAAIVINAQTGIEAITSKMMEDTGNQRLCRMIIVNKIDINFDLYSDTPEGKDPDSFSPTFG